MKISSVICTRNRAAYLPHAIRSLAEQDIENNDYEIIVVDNGSTDGTRQIVNSLTDEMPNLRYVYEEKPGLSNARNRGLEEAAAPVVAFLDDDAIAVPGWLAAILNGFNVEPQPVCVGGPVETWWDVPRPAWFPDSLVGCHNRYYGAEPHWCSYPVEQPIGCNMAFLKEPVAQVGGFNGQLEKYNDETELIARLVELGGRIFYEPRATVRHLLPKERLRLGWQLRRHYDEGKSLGGMHALSGHRSRSRRVAEVGRNLLAIGKRSIRLVVSRSSIRGRVQRLADLSLLIGKTVYITKSLREE
jgi:glycosyltransferase involved in cell wall biosynthesis